ncbi:MAG TPA: CHASE2 domain-containing protein [Geobacteraceae bacterium]
MFRLTPNSQRPLARRDRLLIMACGFVLTLVFCAFSFSPPSFLSQLDDRFFDSLISGGASPREDLRPAVVAIDNDSLARFGRWPWPRALVARLLTRVAEQGPAAVGIDAIFAEPEGSSFDGEPAGRGGRLTAGDMALAEALGKGPFVLGFAFTFDPEGPAAADQGLLQPLNMAFLQKKGAADSRSQLWRASGSIDSLPRFTRSAAGSGFINAAVERDGILRRIPLIIERGGKVYPSLALAAVLTRVGAYRATLESGLWEGCVLRIGSLGIPLDERGRLRLRYGRWVGDGKPVSAAALLEGRVGPDRLKGRVVFVGATATGMGEAVATPAAVMLSGVQVHAVAAENMLSGAFARPAPWLLRLLAVLALGLLSTIVCARFPVTRGAILLGIAALATWQGALWLFRNDGLLLSPLLPLFALGVNFSLFTIIRALFVEKSALRQTHDLAATRDFIMTSLASLAEIRDTETGAHILRTQRYLLILCRELSGHPRFEPLLKEETIELIAKLAPLHDIGKVGLPDHLLRKTSGFTAEEYEEVKKHALYGRNAIANAESRAGALNDEMMQYAKDIAYYHHERWDGTGYPEGLRGDQIPWPARLMALADAYDAMVSRRIYKEPMPHEVAVRIILEGKGRLFDPDVVDAFLAVELQWRQIAAELDDSAEIEVAVD